MKKNKAITPYKNLSDIRKVLKAYEAFVKNFETVFYSDWDHTVSTITDPNFVGETESFIESDFGESDPWSNRHNLLTSYKIIKEIQGKKPVWESPIR